MPVGLYAFALFWGVDAGGGGVSIAGERDGERGGERERESNPEDCFRAAVDQLCRGERERERE